MGVSDLYYCHAHSLCGGQKGLKTEGFLKFTGGVTGVSYIRASVDALCRDGTSKSHVIRVQNASKLGEKA